MPKHRSAFWRSLGACLSGIWAIIALVVVLIGGMLILRYGGRACDRIAATCTGVTPDIKIRSAMLERDLPELRRLLAEGMSVDIPDTNGSTAVLYAVSSRDPEVVALVAARSRDIDHVDRSGCTPLFVAVNLGDTETVQILLQHGASPFAANVGGRTVYEMAQQRASARILHLLERGPIPPPAGLPHNAAAH